MAISINRCSRSLVRPFGQTPSESLYLSFIDGEPVLRINVAVLLVFRHGGLEAAKVIRESLAKALASYYPLAGRVKESGQGQLQVECCGKGALFVQATANCTLEVVNYLSYGEETPISHNELLPNLVPDEIKDAAPVVQIQVTEFTCGGYVIGFQFFHGTCDGIGAAQFLNAVGDLGRGLDHLSISPVWCRNLIPKPEQANYPILPPPMPDYRLEHATVDFSTNKIEELKKGFHDSTGQTCTAFEVLAAVFWRSRTIAIDLKPDAKVTLLFMANCRHLMDPPLPEGYYGNCFFPMKITASSESLAQASNVEMIKTIQEAKAKLPTMFSKYVKGDRDENGEDLFAPSVSYNTLMISDWRRLGFNEVDCGWGHPVHIVPIQDLLILPIGVPVLGSSLPKEKGGIRLATWCIEDAHRQAFMREMMKFT